MSWNYRIIKHEDYYGLHEVYYDDEGEVDAWTLEPLWVGDDIKDLQDSLETAWMDSMRRKALDIKDVEK